MILNMYITLMPVILAGIANMIFTKTNICKRNAYPIDGGRCLADGRPVFGSHKTYIGFAGYILSGAVMQCLWGKVCVLFSFTWRNEFYIEWADVFCYNLWVGLTLGFAYALFELPNSFVKRRLGIPEGKTVEGVKGKVFFVIDQIDSIIGVVLVLSLFSPLSFCKGCFYIFLGGLTHIVVNLILYLCKIRKSL